MLKFVMFVCVCVSVCICIRVCVTVKRWKLRQNNEGLEDEWTGRASGMEKAAATRKGRYGDKEIKKKEMKRNDTK